MPRKIDPALITVGGGLAGHDTIEANAIIPAASGHEPAHSDGGGGGLYALELHIKDEHNAHPAHSVSIDSVPDIYDAAHVEGVLDELAALVPPRPPTLGLLSQFHTLDCRPDWGILKLDDSSYYYRDADGALPDGWGVGSTDQGREIYPYYHVPPWVASSFTPPGDDPMDPLLNVYDDDYRGGGRGEAHAGAFTRLDPAGNNHQMVLTHRIIPSKQPGEAPELGRPVVVSGAVYPADRGTLALLRGNPSTGFTGVDALDRVVCAINLGQGILDHCDGDPGGIFWLGTPGGEFAPHSHDPFSYPGRATGQYNLHEIHTGVSSLSGAGNLPAPFFDMDGDGVQGWSHGGQVRLGSDPNAGVPVILDGLPILGGSSAARAGGNDNNFLAYRLPVLETYDTLKWVPPAELARYFTYPSVSADPGDHMDEAGNYPDAPQDWWTHQIARFRHQFHLPNEALPAGDPRDCGSYVLVHFKKEEYFEEAVRDGVWPTDDRVYSVNLYSWADLEDTFNVAAPAGSPAGDEAADCYHVIRTGVYEDPKAGDVFGCEIINIPVTVAAGPVFDLAWPGGVAFDLLPGGRYRFELSDASVTGHPFHLSTTPDGTHGGGVPYETGIKYFGDGSEVDQATWHANFDAYSERVLELTVSTTTFFDGGGNLFWFCHTHPGMGGPLTIGTGLAGWTAQIHNAVGEISFEALRFVCVSGVGYHTPLNSTATGVMAPWQQASWKVTDLDLSWKGANTVDPGYAGVFEHSYRTHEGTDLDGIGLPWELLGNMHPVFLSFSAFTPEGEGDIGPCQGLFESEDGSGSVARERVGFDAPDLILGEANSPVPIPDNMARIRFDSANPPSGGAHGDAAVCFGGDARHPKFSGDAIMRAFVRKPLWHKPPLWAYTDYYEGWEIALTSGGVSGKLLWHGGGWGLLGTLDPLYGNHAGQSSMYENERDSEERFLDEAYRLRPFRAPDLSPLWLDMAGNPFGLVELDTFDGPGLPHGTFPNMPLGTLIRPVGMASGVSWIHAPGFGGIEEWHRHSFVGMSTSTPQAQVAGWPDRDPSILEGVYSPTPSTGLLMYPQKDYSSGYLPTTAEVQHPSVLLSQPDYSALTGDREWMRFFAVPDGAGQPFVRIQVAGLTVEDILWTADGSQGIQLLVKIPGMTTWLDIGRPDGDGPSKQDAFSDGAGCMVVGPDTRNGEIPGLNIVRSQVLVNLGPAANLLEGPEGAALLFKVVVRDNAKGRAFNLEQGGSSGPTSDLRGLMALRVLGGKGAGDGTVETTEDTGIWDGPWEESG